MKHIPYRIIRPAIIPQRPVKVHPSKIHQRQQVSPRVRSPIPSVLPVPVPKPIIHQVPLSDIGVGILSYNRLHTIQRLLASIRRHSDLSKLKVFISDESTDNSVGDWIKQQTDISSLVGQPRIGVAGNTNRVMRYLSKFKYCIMLNDDVEILSKGWESFYASASIATHYKHFCFRQYGIYGANTSEGGLSTINGYQIRTINAKPLGAVMFYTLELFNKIGYFDENFGPYGAEHVDWSSRAYKSGMQPYGYHDVMGSSNFFKIHNEQSAVSNRGANLSAAKAYLRKVSSDPNRIYINASDQSIIPQGI